MVINYFWVIAHAVYSLNAILSVIVGDVAEDRMRSWSKWFTLALVISAPLSYIVLCVCEFNKKEER